jgi:hypothetical protein
MGSVLRPVRHHARHGMTVKLMKKYFVSGVEEALGPYTRSQIDQFLEEGILTEKTQVWQEGDDEWSPLGEHPDFCDAEAELKQPSKEEQSSVEEDQVKLEKSRAEIPKLLESIKEDLDALWECQREAILSRIMDEDLADELEDIRAESREYYKRVEVNAVDCWRKDGQLLNWITECIKKHADYTFPIPVEDNPDLRMEIIISWLQTVGLSGIRGCYCWKENESYLYVGQASRLETRIKSYKTRDFFSKATHVRIMVPNFKGCRTKTHFKRKLNALERLLLLQYEPIENRDKNGHKGFNNADDCLNYIMGEVQELATDVS